MFMQRKHDIGKHEVYSDSKWRCAGHSSTRIEGQSDVENGSQGRGGEDGSQGRGGEDGRIIEAHHTSALWSV